MDGRQILELQFPKSFLHVLFAQRAVPVEDEGLGSACLANVRPQSAELGLRGDIRYHYWLLSVVSVSEDDVKRHRSRLIHL